LLLWPWSIGLVLRGRLIGDVFAVAIEGERTVGHDDWLSEAQLSREQIADSVVFECSARGEMQGLARLKG